MLRLSLPALASHVAAGNVRATRKQPRVARALNVGRHDIAQWAIIAPLAGGVSDGLGGRLSRLRTTCRGRMWRWSPQYCSRARSIAANERYLPSLLRVP